MFRNTVSIWNICCWTCFRHSGCHKSMTDDITLYLNWCFSVLAARIGLRFLGRTDWSHFGHNDLLNSTDCFESESFVHESELCHSCKCLQGWISPCFDCFTEYGCHKFRELHVLKTVFLVLLDISLALLSVTTLQCIDCEGLMQVIVSRHVLWISEQYVSGCLLKNDANEWKVRDEVRKGIFASDMVPCVNPALSDWYRIIICFQCDFCAVLANCSIVWMLWSIIDTSSEIK